VWEIWPAAGASGAIGGGGRYDGLAEQLGGRPTPGVGWASGVERIVLELKDQQVVLPSASDIAAYVVYQSDSGKRWASRLAEDLRAQGIAVDVAFGDRKLGKQLGAASKSGARFALILGDDEVASQSVTVKDLRDGGDQERLALDAIVARLRA
jgi:histidyl-tRNA synthetase